MASSASKGDPPPTVCHKGFRWQRDDRINTSAMRSHKIGTSIVPLARYECELFEGHLSYCNMCASHSTHIDGRPLSLTREVQKPRKAIMHKIEELAPPEMFKRKSVPSLLATQVVSVAGTVTCLYCLDLLQQPIELPLFPVT